MKGSLKLGNRSGSDTSIRDFVLGMILVVIGLYNIFKNTSIGVIWIKRVFGIGLPSGVVTIPILLGIALVFFNKRWIIGWVLMAIGVILLLITLIMSLNIIFTTTSLLDYFLMFGGTFGGGALLLRALLR